MGAVKAGPLDLAALANLEGDGGKEFELPVVAGPGKGRTVTLTLREPTVKEALRLRQDLIGAVRGGDAAGDKVVCDWLQQLIEPKPEAKAFVALVRGVGIPGFGKLTDALCDFAGISGKQEEVVDAGPDASFPAGA